MRAKIIKPTRGVPDGQVYPIDLAVDAVVDGDLAETLIAAGEAEEIDEDPAPRKSKKTADK